MEIELNDRQKREINKQTNTKIFLEQSKSIESNRLMTYLVSSSSGVKCETTLSSWYSAKRRSVDGVPDVILQLDAAELMLLVLFA